ncbi:hypothetical protein F5Y15DRAFT_96484 [Xylariaceae sp. FL0016]|nr:hypothetical protein F5Y15DRAFT_96484 [Xylariaceae sp. FL0016]
METPASASRGRGRSSTRKRLIAPARSSSQRGAEGTKATEAVEQPPSGTPSTTMANSSFTFETPSPSASRGTRARARNTEGATPSDEPDSKGGRSLRKRARVDYTFEHVDEDMSDITKATPAATRALKKRRSDFSLADVDADEELDADVKRRASEQPPSVTRRRMLPRKSTAEPQAYVPDEPLEDAEVQDTIEVGGHLSDESDGSILRRTSSGSSYNDGKGGQSTSVLDSVEEHDFSHPQNGRKRKASNTMTNGPANNHKSPKRARLSEKDTPAIVVDKASATPHEHITPYIEGSWTLYPASRVEAEAEPDVAQEDIGDEEVVDDQVDGIEENTPAGSPGPAETAANSPAADPEPPYIQPPHRKPIAFKELRQASDFTDMFEDAKSLSQVELYRRLEIANQALVQWQNEYNELRKITDDEANAARYHQEEASYQHRRKMALSKDPDANPLRKDFVVKGIRAEKPPWDVTIARQQDRIMADAYDFEYDEKDTKIGRQDPAAQKIGAGKGRLRERPKQTAKAAEADDSNVVHGKRSRKPPTIYDGVEAASRSSTPAPPPRRRGGRPRKDAEQNGTASLPIPHSLPSSFELETPKKRKGGRPRKHPLPEPIPEDFPVQAPGPEPEHEQVVEEKPTRKRRRRKGASVAAEDGLPNGTPSNTTGKPNPRRGTASRISEVPSGSFYSTSSLPSTNAADDSRPATASSTATEATVASNSYQLREKRQKKFTLNTTDDEHEQEVEPEPKPKRVRRPTKKAQGENLTSATAFVPSQHPPHVSVLQPEPEAPPAPKPPTRIKLMNYNGPPTHAPTSAPTAEVGPVLSATDSAPSPTVNGTSNGSAKATPNGDLSDSAKDYSQMTKSEKMSHSMRARWASGSMQVAVAKRRETLAAKKQATSRPVEPSPVPEFPPMRQQ